MSVKILTGLDNNNQRIINVADPTQATDAANKSYVDNVAAGLDWKENVRVASTTNINIASPGATINGVTMATNDRFLAKDQSTGSQNGIYVWNGAATPATRATDADSSADIQNMIVRASEGSVKPDTMWQLVTDAVNLGTTSLIYTEFSGGGTTYTADGNGIELSGTVFSLELDGSSLAKSSSGLRIAAAFLTAMAGNGLTESSGVLAVGAGTGISVAADTVGIDIAVVPRKWSGNCVATTNPQTFNHNLNNGNALVEIMEASSKKKVITDVTNTDANNVSVDFGGAPTSGQYTVQILG